jgi:hypothetical protein
VITQEPRVGGAIVIEQMKVMRELYGDEAFMRAMRSLPPQVCAEFESAVPVGWYSVHGFAALKTAVARVVGEDPILLQHRVVKIGVVRTVNFVWRMMMRHATDDMLIRRTPLLYSRTFDRGEAAARIVGPGRAEVVVRGWQQIPEFDIEGLSAGIAAVLGLARRVDAHVHWERQLGGVIFRAWWRR